MTWLDLNADLGEGIGNDEAMLELVSSESLTEWGKRRGAGSCSH